MPQALGLHPVSVAEAWLLQNLKVLEQHFDLFDQPGVIRSLWMLMRMCLIVSFGAPLLQQRASDRSYDRMSRCDGRSVSLFLWLEIELLATLEQSGRYWKGALFVTVAVGTGIGAASFQFSLSRSAILAATAFACLTVTSLPTPACRVASRANLLFRGADAPTAVLEASKRTSGTYAQP